MIHRITHGSAPNRTREQRPGSFQKGHAKLGGRQPGTPNVMTKELKVAVIEAASRLGSDLRGRDGVEGYLMRLAKNDMKTFVMLLRAVLPLQIKEEIRNRRYYSNEPVRYPTTAEIREKMRQLGMPVLLRRLEPVVRLMREGKSASEALQAVGLNARLEIVAEPSVKLDLFEECSLCYDSLGDADEYDSLGDADEQSSNDT